MRVDVLLISYILLVGSATMSNGADENFLVKVEDDNTWRSDEEGIYMLRDDHGIGRSEMNSEPVLDVEEGVEISNLTGLVKHGEHTVR